MICFTSTQPETVNHPTSHYPPMCQSNGLKPSGIRGGSYMRWRLSRPKIVTLWNMWAPEHITWYHSYEIANQSITESMFLFLMLWVCFISLFPDNHEANHVPSSPSSGICCVGQLSWHQGPEAEGAYWGATTGTFHPMSLLWVGKGQRWHLLSLWRSGSLWKCYQRWGLCV